MNIRYDKELRFLKCAEIWTLEKKHIFDYSIEGDMIQNPMAVTIYKVKTTGESMYSDNEEDSILAQISPSTGVTYLRNIMDQEFKVFQFTAIRSTDIKISSSGTENNKLIPQLRHI